MLELFAIIDSILLIVIIFLRVPRTSVGIASFANKSNLLGSPRSAERFLNLLTALGILVYFGIALKLNLTTQL